MTYRGGNAHDRRKFRRWLLGQRLARNQMIATNNGCFVLIGGQLVRRRTFVKLRLTVADDRIVVTP